MNETLELEVVDLGEATKVTKGPIDVVNSEDHPTQSRRALD